LVEQLICNQQVIGSNPIASSIRISLLCDADYGVLAHVAQQVEHFLGKGEVTGSSPVVGSIQFSFAPSNRIFGLILSKKYKKLVE
jgi:hypothetical protein